MHGKARLRFLEVARRGAILGAAAAFALHASCATDAAPQGLRATPPGSGPLVVFDVFERPLPNIPAPNDVATFADPTSRTGRRINVSMMAPTHLERSSREGFDELEGWGTFMPISVSFRPEPGAPAGSAAIDLGKLRSAMQHDGHDMTNDPVYVINLKTGVPAMLDVGDGNFPVTIRDLENYYPNDPRLTEHNVLLETAEEGAGLTQASYSPALDTDFDGVLDHPNALAPQSPASYVRGIDDIMTWYERETDTLIVRPLLPLAEKTEYAVVLTDRLTGPDGQPVRSPFAFVHHPTQNDAMARLRAVLGDARRANYYGDLAGTGLDHVAFAWSFTTAPTLEDLRLLRDGLHGVGPFSKMATMYPPKATAYRLAGLARDLVDDPPGWQQDPHCATAAQKPYVVRFDQLESSLEIIARAIAGSSVPEAQVKAIEDSLGYVDHLVIGSFPVSYLLGDPDHEDPNLRFSLNYKTGEGRFGSDVGHFILAVPKPRNGATQPFDTVVWAHGTAQSDIEILIRAGYFARQGMATFGFDAPGHGFVLNSGTQTLLQGVLQPGCLVPTARALTTGRARDLNADGTPDSGGLLWTSHIFHSRDNIRQTVLDQVQAARVLRAFDGRTGDQDTDGDGTPNLLGDFDADGTPDVGGPNANLYTSGDSYGGIVAQIHAAIDPEIAAGASISGAGGLTDVATRSYGVVDSVVEQIISPIVIAVPASQRTATGDAPDTRCTGDARSVRMVVNDLINSKEIELACLTSAELDRAMTVVVTNTTSGEARCGRTGDAGTFRVPIPASVGDHLDVQVFTAPDAVRSYKTCEISPDAPAGRAVRTFEQAAATIGPVADASSTCTSDQGCAQYRDQFFPVGSPLFAVQEGLGLRRQTPELRRLFQLTQGALDSADPVSFAPLFMVAQNTGYAGAPLGPKPFMDANTVGDGFVVVGAGASFARAMGALPFLPPEAAASMPEYADYATPYELYAALGQKTPNDAMIEHWAIEGNGKLGRTPAGPACAPNYHASADCTASTTPDPDTCARTMFDSDWHAEGADLYDAQHAAVPLRLARLAGVHATDTTTLSSSWKPRIKGAPFTKDGSYDGMGGPLVALVNAYVNPLGQHVWTVSDPCKAWDDAVYYDGLLGRFLASGGTDLYFLTHAASHGCLATQSCPFLR